MTDLNSHNRSFLQAQQQTHTQALENFLEASRFESESEVLVPYSALTKAGEGEIECLRNVYRQAAMIWEGGERRGGQLS